MRAYLVHMDKLKKRLHVYAEPAGKGPVQRMHMVAVILSYVSRLATALRSRTLAIYTDKTHASLDYSLIILD
jgi:hypothetical protein